MTRWLILLIQNLNRDTPRRRAPACRPNQSDTSAHRFEQGSAANFGSDDSIAICDFRLNPDSIPVDSV